MMEESEDSSDNQPGCGGPGYDNDQEQDVIIIPITNRTQSAAEAPDHCHTQDHHNLADCHCCPHSPPSF